MSKREKVINLAETVTRNDVDKLHVLLEKKAELVAQENVLKDRFRKYFPTGGSLMGSSGRYVVVEKQDRRDLKKVATLLALFKLFLRKDLTSTKLATCMTLNAEKIEKVTSQKFVEQHVTARKKVLAVKTGKTE